MNSRIAALTLALSAPSAAAADLILVEDNRFIEINYEGEMTRLSSPGDPIWKASLGGEQDAAHHGLPIAGHDSTFSTSAIIGSGNVFTALDAGVFQGATSTFDILFRVDRPTFVSLSGQFGFEFFRPPGGPLLFEEDGALIFSYPNDGIEPFSSQTSLKPESTYRLFLEASLFENTDTGGGTEYGHRWTFELEAPELPAAALLPLVLVSIALASCRPAARGTEA
jgi:hypothetical protein